MITKTINLNVNGRAVTATVEPRLHLADFLREQLMLMGTHLGCEHGVCGACTVLIDGEIARSCITYAVACEGAEIRTIENFDDDPVMERLRGAFNEEHGLQCGYCTPGMLIAARDIVTRLPEADEQRIRVELSGNLCRCTGYTGIVAAVRKTLGKGRVGRPLPVTALEQTHRVQHAAQHVPRKTQVNISPAPQSDMVSEVDRGLKTLSQAFVVSHPRATVWRYLEDLEKVITCMPGASLIGPVQDNRFKSQIAVRLGPIGATFSGDWKRELDNDFCGLIEGNARDNRTATRIRGQAKYCLLKEDGDATTRVDVKISFSLAGPLAQFGRGGIVQDLATRLTAAFADNLQARLDGIAELKPGEEGPTSPVELKVGGLFASVIWARIKEAFASVFRRP